MRDTTRKRNWQTNKTREKIRDSIQTGLIVKRFEKHVLNNEDSEEYVKLTTTQIKAGEVLLGRTLPLLSSSEIIEQHKEEGLQDVEAKLISLVGEELAYRLLGKSDQTHEAPEQTQ